MDAFKVYGYFRWKLESGSLAWEVSEAFNMFSDWLECEDLFGLMLSVIEEDSLGSS